MAAAVSWKALRNVNAKDAIVAIVKKRLCSVEAAAVRYAFRMNPAYSSFGVELKGIEPDE
jgi:hypothetical protein